MRCFHLIVILWAVRQGEINRAQMAKNCAINRVREFTFPLSENINHLKPILERRLLFWEVGLASQVFLLNAEKGIKWTAEDFRHILVASPCAPPAKIPVIDTVKRQHWLGCRSNYLSCLVNKTAVEIDICLPSVNDKPHRLGTKDSAPCGFCDFFSVWVRRGA